MQQLPRTTVRTETKFRTAIAANFDFASFKTSSENKQGGQEANREVRTE